MDKQQLIEIARSYSYKLNIGNYQTMDFFCSRKEETTEEEAEKKSKELHAFCKTEVLQSIMEYQDEKERGKEVRKQPFVAKSDLDDETAREMRQDERENENRD